VPKQGATQDTIIPPPEEKPKPKRGRPKKVKTVEVSIEGESSEKGKEKADEVVEEKPKAKRGRKPKKATDTAPPLSNTVVEEDTKTLAKNEENRGNDHHQIEDEPKSSEGVTTNCTLDEAGGYNHKEESSKADAVPEEELYDIVYEKDIVDINCLWRLIIKDWNTVCPMIADPIIHIVLLMTLYVSINASVIL